MLLRLGRPAAVALTLLLGVAVGAPSTVAAGPRRASGEVAGPRRASGEARRTDAARRVRVRVHRELDGMARRLGPRAAAESPLAAIRASLDGSLSHIDRSIAAGRIVPDVALVAHDPASRLPREVERLVDRGPRRPPARRGRPVRIGVLPTAFNPPHWGHVGIALKAMAERELDHVVVVPAGADPRKPNLLPVADRHPMAHDLIARLSPLFSYSPIAAQTGLDGESNLFRLLGLNPDMAIEAHYLFGDDHYQRFYLTDGAPDPARPDTLEKLARKIGGREAGFDPRRHAVSGLVLLRDAATLPRVDVGYPVNRLGALPFEASSTRIRGALDALSRGEAADPHGLALLPERSLRFIERRGLYGARPR